MENKEESTNFVIDKETMDNLSEMGLDVKTTSSKNPILADPALVEQYTRALQQSLAFKQLKKPQMQRDPNLVIKDRKSKRRLRNKNRKINQAKSRQSRFSK